jgi:hypothetical protein
MTRSSKKSNEKPKAQRARVKQKLLPPAGEADRTVSSQLPPEAASGAALPTNALSSEAGQRKPAAAAKPRARNRKPVRIGDALRQRGFDEHTIADHYVDVAHRLKGKSDKSGGVEKLLVDVLKECSKHLEPPRPMERTDERSGARGAAVHVHLVHSVTRPARAARQSAVGVTGPATAVSGGEAEVATESNGE